MTDFGHGAGLTPAQVLGLLAAQRSRFIVQIDRCIWDGASVDWSSPTGGVLRDCYIRPLTAAEKADPVESLRGKDTP